MAGGKSFKTMIRKVAKARAMRKYVSKSRIPRRIKQPVQFFKRTVYLPNLYVSSSLSDVFFAQVFRLTDVPNVTEFTSLYDQYQIKGVRVKLMPKFDTATQTGTGTIPTAQHVMNRVFSALDYDDNTAVTAVSDLTQYQNMRQTKGTRDHVRYFKPRCLSEAYGGLGTTHYMPKANQWIDTSNPGTPHYAIKWGITQCALNLSYDMQIDYYLAFKNVR